MYNIKYLRAKIPDLLGKVLVNIKVSSNDDEILFATTEGKVFLLKHDQSCCESVVIESIVGDLADLIGEPLTAAEVSSKPSGLEAEESSTWTFYKFATCKGYVDIRWLGESNGYYSEEVDFFEVTGTEKEKEIVTK